MTRTFVLCFLLMIASASVRGSEPPVADFRAHLLKAGLALDGPDASPAAALDPSKLCAGVSFSRGLKYGESDLNVLDVATVDSPGASPRPVLLFVAGESFS